MKLEKWTRARSFPTLPLGDNNSKIAGSSRHIALCRKAACEGTVLLKNERDVLPLKKGTKLAIFGITQIAIMCGFGNLRSFNRSFISAYKCMPTEYRKRTLA